MGYLAGNLPSSVQFLSFSNSLSPESVETLCLLLLKNNASFRYESQDSMLQPLVEEIMVGLLGLSIMNQVEASRNLIAVYSRLYCSSFIYRV